jgi:SAM-dependent methyltransferase
MNSRIENEIEHGRKISEDAENVWNWSSPAGSRRAERRATYIVDFGKITGRDKVLEIGAGTGLFTGKVYDRTHAQIVATDISEELLEVARKKYSGIEFRTADAMALDFADATFDVVFGSSVLHHLDMDKSLKEIFRVLKPGGRIVFEEPNMLNPQIFIQKNIPFIKKWLGDSPDETAIVRWKMKALMERNGFRNVKLFPVDFLHPSTPSFLVKPVKWLSDVLQEIPLIKEIAGSIFIYGEKTN